MVSINSESIASPYSPVKAKEIAAPRKQRQHIATKESSICLFYAYCGREKKALGS
jgi:hypothetical protein